MASHGPEYHKSFELRNDTVIKTLGLIELIRRGSWWGSGEMDGDSVNGLGRDFSCRNRCFGVLESWEILGVLLEHVNFRKIAFLLFFCVGSWCRWGFGFRRLFCEGLNER